MATSADDSKPSDGIDHDRTGSTDYVLNKVSSASSGSPHKGQVGHGLATVSSENVESPVGNREPGVLGDHAEEGRGGDDGGEIEYKVYKRRWFGLVQLVFLNIIVSWDWLTWSPVSQEAATYYRTSESAINWLATGFLFAFVVAAPVTIYLLHLGPKPSIVASAALVLVGNWVRYAGSHDSSSGAAGKFGVVLFGQILCGFAQPFVLAAPTRYSDMWFTNRGRVAATAVSSLANPFGAALGELVVPFMVTKPSEVSNMVLYVAIISTIIAVPAIFIPSSPPTPPSPSGTEAKTPLRESFRLLFSSLEVWLILVPIFVYVGFFNSISSLLNQIMLPWGYTSDEAGIAGAILIVVGLVASAIASPILDRTKAFVLAIRSLVPVIALSYLVFIWMPSSTGGGLAGPYAVLAILGASSFILIPVALELLCELSHPLSPEITSTIGWGGGQILGGIFIIISDALKAGPNAETPGDMTNALIFTAVISLVVAPLPLALGMFGRKDKLKLRRMENDRS